jgi:predicted RNA methylase
MSITQAAEPSPASQQHGHPSNMQRLAATPTVFSLALGTLRVQEKDCVYATASPLRGGLLLLLPHIISTILYMSTKYVKLYKKYKSKYTDLKKKLFPHKPNIDYNKLRISSSSVYSMSQPQFAKKISDIIKYFLKKLNKNPRDSVISECCSNVGGDTISFATEFDKVNAVELNADEYNNLKNNISIYDLTNKVTFHNDDYTEIMNDLHQDVIYLDPPWGGVDYKKHDVLDLYLSNINVADIVLELIQNKRADLIVLKVPNNYNIAKLKETLKDTDKVVYTFDLCNEHKVVFKILVVVNKLIKNDLDTKAICKATT